MRRAARVDALRGTGRTTRMIAEARKAAADPKARVLIIAANQREVVRLSRLVADLPNIEVHSHEERLAGQHYTHELWDHYAREIMRAEGLLP